MKQTYSSDDMLFYFNLQVFIRTVSAPIVEKDLVRTLTNATLNVVTTVVPDYILTVFVMTMIRIMTSIRENVNPL